MTLVYLTAAWVAGIALARGIDPPWQLLALLGLAATLGLLLRQEARSVRLGALSLMMIALGAGRLLLADHRAVARSLDPYKNVSLVTVEGVVAAEPDDRDTHTNLRLRAERVTLPDGTVHRVKGLVLVRTGRFPRRTYGDRLRVTGLLEDPPIYEEFSYRDYLARRGIYAFMNRCQVDARAFGRARSLPAYLFAFKQRVQAVIAGMLPEPQASLLAGILLGVESGIPDEVMEDFEATGTSHIIAISGFNITIVSGLLAGMAGRFLHRRWALLAAIAGVVVYTILVGASAAVVRAALMGGLYLFGRYVGRPSYAPVSLAAAALVMTAWNPYALWDRGFQLSFAATVGLLLYAEPLEDHLRDALSRIASADRARRIVGAVSEGLLVTIASLVTTTPLLLSARGRLSPVTLVSNVFILPAQVYVMLFGGAATILGLVVRPLGRAVAWVAWLFLTYTIEVAQLTAAIPLPSLSGMGEVGVAWVYYAGLAVGTWWLVRPRERRQELLRRVREGLTEGLRPKLLFGASAVLLALAVFAWRSLPDGRLHVHVLDVGQGDAILVETPSGRQVLIDGGPMGSVLLSRLGRRMPFWDRSLDLAVLTHPDADHITGLVEVLERYRVDTVVYRDLGCRDATCQRWQELLEERGTTIHSGEAGLVIELDDVRMELLHPGAELLAGEGFNDNSLVARLSYGQVSVLLTGDIGAVAEERLLVDGADLQSTVLKVAHHGACNSSTRSFLEAVDPEVAVISVGEANDHGHPCDQVVERLKAVLDGGDERLFRTDKHGTVEVVSDGARAWVKAEGD